MGLKVLVHLNKPIQINPDVHTLSVITELQSSLTDKTKANNCSARCRVLHKASSTSSSSVRAVMRCLTLDTPKSSLRAPW